MVNYGRYIKEHLIQPMRDFYRTQRVQAQVKKQHTELGLEHFKRAFNDKLAHNQVRLLNHATDNDHYMALSYAIRDRLINRWLKSLETYHTQDVRRVCYFSAEFLIGRQLGQNLLHSDCWETAQQGLQELGLDLYEILAWEPDPGLGNGGLGRLAACYLESLATLDIPAIGYGIRYEFGIFEQLIKNGWQMERPDYWLQLGNPWEIPRPDYRVEIKLGGRTEFYIDEQGWQRVRWIADRTVQGTPYDTLVPGYDTHTVGTLRLWMAKASQAFNFQLFNDGDYTRAVADKTYSENITKVLYPNDKTPQGQELRLTQQYFFVSCSLQDMIRIHLNKNADLSNFHEKMTVQLNDTHPAIAIAELMRLLIDDHYMSWEKAWHISSHTFAYTNHTLLPEALERWPVRLFMHLLPRHLEIIYEINRRFLYEVQVRYPHEPGILGRLSLIEEWPEKQVRMAHLACVGSYAINGVAAIHSELLKSDLLRDFYHLWPEKFTNVTNGVTPRRWLLLSNPKLSNLLTDTLGPEWVTDLSKLRTLENYLDNAQFCAAWRGIKQENKQDLAECILRSHGVEVNPDSLFDIQIKRLHEYKRQLLKVLHIIALYHRIKANPQAPWQPITFLFGAKAAPGYHMAKLIIKLINSVAEVINGDAEVNAYLSVFFLPNFNVSTGEKIYPAADLSEQISLAGKEASGTGNMKFALNGALTIGTLDGANIEIREQVGAENMFTFGLTVEEVKQLQTSGYNPRDFYAADPTLRAVINHIASGFFSPDEPTLFQPIVDSLLCHDEYLLLADFQAYLRCYEQVLEAYRDQAHWTRMSILNTARVGFFSSDRSIQEYCQKIWQVQAVTVECPQECREIPGSAIAGF